MLLKNHNFYFIKYPPGAGGAHLANLISLDTTFTSKNPELTKQDFIDNLYAFYKKQPVDTILKNKHIDAHCIISSPIWIEQLKRLDYNFNNSIHLGHAACFLIRSKFIEKINRKYITLTFNSEKSLTLLKSREAKTLNTTTLENEYYCHELRYFYSTILNESSVFSTEHILNFEIDEIYVKDIVPIITFINQKFNLNIPLNQAQELHNYWYNKNF